MKKYISLLFIFSILFLSTTTLVIAQSSLPPNLQKIIDYNKQYSTDFSLKISFLIAFVAGMLGILSPCILPFLPAYFSYTFKEKKNITLMTCIFFLGFSLIFVLLGIIAGFIGEQSLAIIQQSWIAILGGMLLFFLGILTLLGIGFSSLIHLNKKFSNDIPGVFLMGIAFALGWTACVGPILAGILGIGAILGNIGHAALLMFFYSLGNLVPLFLLSFFYDKFHLSESRFIKGKMITFNLFHKPLEIHTTNLISGILLLLVGIIMILFQGTEIVNTWDFFNTKQYFYSLQNKLILLPHVNILGTIVLILFIGILSYFLKKAFQKKA